jgi:hypothetical protein
MKSFVVLNLRIGPKVATLLMYKPLGGTMSQFEAKKFWKQFFIGFTIGVILSAASVSMAGDVTPINGRRSWTEILGIKSKQAEQAAIVERTVYIKHTLYKPLQGLEDSQLIRVRTFNRADEMRAFLRRAIADFHQQEISWLQIPNDNGSWSRLQDLEDVTDPVKKAYAKHAIEQQEILKAELKEVEDLIAKKGLAATVVREETMAVSDFKNLLRTEGRLQFEGSHYGTGPSLPRPEIEIHKVAATNISEIRSAAARRPILGRAPK